MSAAACWRILLRGINFTIEACGASNATASTGIMLRVGLGVNAAIPPSHSHFFSNLAVNPSHSIWPLQNTRLRIDFYYLFKWKKIHFDILFLKLWSAFSPSTSRLPFNSLSGPSLSFWWTSRYAPFIALVKYSHCISTVRTVPAFVASILISRTKYVSVNLSSRFIVYIVPIINDSLQPTFHFLFQRRQIKQIKAALTGYAFVKHSPPLAQCWGSSLLAPKPRSRYVLSSPPKSDGLRRFNAIERIHW